MKTAEGLSRLGRRDVLLQDPLCRYRAGAACLPCVARAVSLPRGGGGSLAPAALHRAGATRSPTPDLHVQAAQSRYRNMAVDLFRALGLLSSVQGRLQAGQSGFVELCDGLGGF